MKFPYILMGVAMLLNGCTDPKFADPAVNSIAAQGNSLIGAAATQRNGGVVDAASPLGASPTGSRTAQFEESNGKPLPAALETADSVDISMPAAAGIDDILVTIQAASGITITLRRDYDARIAGAPVADIPGAMKIAYRGSLSKILNEVGDRFDLAWSYDGRAVRFDRLTTKSYDMPIPPTAGNIATTLAGVNVGGNSTSYSRGMDVDPWKEVEAAMANVVRAPATFTVSRASGQVTVFGSPSTQREASALLERFSAIYSRRVALEIGTFFIDVEKVAENGFGGNITGNKGTATASLGDGLNTAIESGIGVINTSNFGASFSLETLSKDTSVVDYRMSNTVAQNGVVAPVSLLNSKNYISSITQATTDTPSAIETATINSGISIYALPRLMADGRIQLSVWLTQSTLNALDSFDTGVGTVQLPDTDQRAVEYTLILNPGETLVMGGYEQESASKTRSKTLGGLTSGMTGNKDGNTQKTRMVFMVKPTILGQ